MMEATLMNRSVLSALVLTSLGCLTACGAEPNDQASFGDEDVSIAEQALGDQSPWSAHMAAVGDLSLRCWGTVGPNTYTTKNGWLQPTRRGCDRVSNENPEVVWKQLEGNLGIAFLENSPEHPNPDADKHSREAAAYMVNTWNAWANNPTNPPPPQGQCPRWQQVSIAQTPEDEAYFATLPRAKKGEEVKEFDVFGKTLPIYNISSNCDPKNPSLRCSDPCQGNPKCLLSYAARCGGGFGYPFLHKKGVTVNPDGSLTPWLQVDPLYWEQTQAEYPDSDNPFMEDDYFHGMSFWGPSPGAVYGAVAREWEPCSVKSGVSHIVTNLKAVWCSASPVNGVPQSWMCLTQCRM
jgi:hypothetical protein